MDYSWGNLHSKRPKSWNHLTLRSKLNLLPSFVIPHFFSLLLAGWDLRPVSWPNKKNPSPTTGDVIHKERRLSTGKIPAFNFLPPIHKNGTTFLFGWVFLFPLAWKNGGRKSGPEGLFFCFNPSKLKAEEKKQNPSSHFGLFEFEKLRPLVVGCLYHWENFGPTFVSKFSTKQFCSVRPGGACSRGGGVPGEP